MSFPSRVGAFVVHSLREHPVPVNPQSANCLSSSRLRESYSYSSSYSYSNSRTTDDEYEYDDEDDCPKGT